MAKNRHDQMTVAYNVYDSKNKLMGVTSVTLPTLEWISSTLSGAGIAGNVEVVATGMMEAMTLGMAFRMVTEAAVALAGPKQHIITLRNAQQFLDPVAGAVGVEKVKHVFSVMPKSLNFGNVQQASPNDASGQYAVCAWAMYIGNKCMLDIDPINGKCKRVLMPQ